MPLRLTGGAAFRHVRAALFAERLHACLTFGHGDEAIMIGVQTGEGLFRLALDLGDRDRAAGRHALAVVGHAGTVMHPGHSLGAVRARLEATPGLGGARSVEFGAADRPVAVRIHTLEAGVGAFRRAGLEGRAHFLGSDGAVAVSVSGGQALHALANELGLADTTVAIGVSPHGVRGPRLRPGLLRQGCAAGGGEGQGGESAGQKDFSHHMISMAARRGRFVPV